MTKHKAGESKAERKFRRLAEHNKKMITEHFHLDYDKHGKEHMKDLGEYYRSITAKFTDKEMEEAELIGRFIIDRIKPEDGVSHKEMAYCLWGEKCLEDDTYVSKIDRLLYVLQMIVLEFMFDTTVEAEEEKAGGRKIPIVPYVKSTKKIRVKGEGGDSVYKEYDKPFQMIFNAAANRDYAFEAFEKSGAFRKLTKNDYARVGIRPLSKEDRESETILNNLKGLGNQDIVQYMEELERLVERIRDTIANVGLPGMLEDDFINAVIPESKGKSDLEPYRLKFNDAMYMLYKAQEQGGVYTKGSKYSKYKKAVAEWLSRG
jgi:hypothetical protein